VKQLQIHPQHLLLRATTWQQAWLLKYVYTKDGDGTMTPEEEHALVRLFYLYLRRKGIPDDGLLPESLQKSTRDCLPFMLQIPRVFETSSGPDASIKGALHKRLLERAALSVIEGTSRTKATESLRRKKAFADLFLAHERQNNQIYLPHEFETVFLPLFDFMTKVFSPLPAHVSYTRKLERAFDDARSVYRIALQIDGGQEGAQIALMLIGSEILEAGHDVRTDLHAYAILALILRDVGHWSPEKQPRTHTSATYGAAWHYCRAFVSQMQRLEKAKLSADTKSARATKTEAIRRLRTLNRLASDSLALFYMLVFQLSEFEKLSLDDLDLAYFTVEDVLVAEIERHADAVAEERSLSKLDEQKVREAFILGNDIAAFRSLRALPKSRGAAETDFEYMYSVYSSALPIFDSASKASPASDDDDISTDF
jgi:hypothetical protein